MLYTLVELQKAALTPARVAAQALHTTLSLPWLPANYTRLARTLTAGADVFERLTRPYGKPAFGLNSTVVDGKTVSVTEDLSLSLPFCNLVHFRRDVATRNDPKLLIVAPISGHYATLLRGTVEALLPDHDVYITDWINAHSVPLSEGGFDLHDNVSYLVQFLQHLGGGTSMMAVCQPSVPVLAAATLMAQNNDPARPPCIVLMGGPIDTRRNPTAVNSFAKERPIEWFEKTLIHTVPANFPGAGRRVYPGFLQLTGFISMNQQRHHEAFATYFQNVRDGNRDAIAQHRSFYDEYLSVLDMSAEFYLQTVSEVFQKHSLPCGTLEVNGQIVNPGAITDIGLFTIEGGRDDITGPGQTVAAHDLCPNLPADLHKHHLEATAGHYGIFSGRHWRQDISPLVRDFVREQSQRVGA